MSDYIREFVGPMHSWIVKGKRAKEHLDWLKAEFQWFREGRPCHFGTKVSGQPILNEVVCESVDSVPLKWSAVIGECVNGYRSVLDHIVYFLAQARGQATDKTEFPIFVEPQKYKHARGQKIGGLHEDTQAFIDGLQPKNRSDPLWLLHQLAIIDKHRRIHVAVMVLSGATLRVGKAHIGFAQDVTKRRLQPGTVVARFGDDDLRRWGADLTKVASEVDMDFRFAFDIAFDQAEDATGLGVRQTLDAIDKSVHTVVDGLERWLPAERPPA